jgi:hypothetical protein
MTLLSDDYRNDYIAAGGQYAFTYAFKILDKTHLAVYQDGALLVVDTDYTVSGVGDDAGGLVTFINAPVAGTTIAIIRAAPYTQEVSLPLGGIFPSTSVEAALDQQTMLAQQLKEITDRSIKFSSASGLKDIPFPDLVASQFLQVNALGTGLQLVAGTPFTAPTFLNGSPFFAAWYEASNFASIHAAVAAIGTTQATLEISTPQYLSANLTIPANISVVVRKGGYIVKTSSYTLTISGSFTAGDYQVFSAFNFADVSFLSGSEVRSIWFGNATQGVDFCFSQASYFDLSMTGASTVIFGLYRDIVSLGNAGNAQAIAGQALARRNSGEHCGIYGAGGGDAAGCGALATVWGGDFHAYSTSAVSAEPKKRGIEVGIHCRHADDSYAIGIYLHNQKLWPDGFTNNYRAGRAIHVIGEKYDGTAGWEVGISLDEAKISDGAAITLASDQMVYWLGTTNVALYRSGNGITATHGFDISTSSGGVYKIGGTQVVGARVIDARCDDTINSGDATTDGVIDSLRDAMITHGLIAAA